MKTKWSMLLIVYLTLIPGFGQEILAQHQKLTDEEKRILSAPEDYSVQEVHDASMQLASQYFMSDLSRAIEIYQDDIAFCKAKNQPTLAGESLNALAEIYYMQRKTETSALHFKESISLLEESKLMRSDALLRLGNCYMLMNQMDSAKKYTDLGAQIVFDNELTLRYTNTYINLGEIALHDKRLVSAAEYYSRALDYTDDAGIPMRKANILMNLGTIYSNLDDPENAQEHYEQALTIVQKEGYKTSESRLLKNLGNVQSSLGNLDEAISFYLQALPYLEEKEKDIDLIEMYSSLSYTYLKKGDLQASKKYLDLAEQRITEDVIDQFQHAFFAAHGEYHLAAGNLTTAELSFRRQKEIAEDSGVERKVINAMSGLMRVAEKRNNPTVALAMTKAYYEKKDSLFNLSQSRLIYDYEARYQKAERDLAIANLSTQNEAQQTQLALRKTQLLFSIGGIVALGVIALWLLRLYRRLNEQNKIITEAHEEKTMLLKEIHHRVKNNLQVVSSLLGLQSRYVKDEMVIDAIKTGRSRVQSMSILHQSLYQNEDLKSIELKKYFENLGQNLFETYQLDDKQIDFEMDIEEIEMDIDVVVPMGLIVNELISNALKHAFHGRDQGRIRLEIKKEDGEIQMSVSDDGVGMVETELPERSKSLGVQLIKSFAEKLNAKIEISNESGTQVRLKFTPKIIAEAA